jgi:hypothetical protein
MRAPFLTELPHTEDEMTKFAIMTLITLCWSCGDSAQQNSQTASLPTASHVARQKVAGLSPNVPLPDIVYTWNSRADVYDLANRWANVRSKSRLDRPTEFGGALDFCNTESLYCLRSYLEIVVPRKFPFPPRWGTAGYKCRQLRSGANASGVVKAECQFRTDSATTFEYSPESGVLRYRRTCPACDNGNYELLSERGLFPAS